MGWRFSPATMAAHLSGGEWIAARHLQYISARISNGIRKGRARIIVTMPPRHGKSELLSVNTPPWILELDPKNRVILASYGAELATEFGAKARDLVLEHQDEFKFVLRNDARQKNRWVTDYRGGMVSTGVGGVITGRGANVLLIDDYIKNTAAALSETQRENDWQWFLSTALTRLEPGGSVIILATRWHHDDIIGRIFRHWPNRYEVINLPAFAEADDLLGREIGEPLWPERYTREDLEELEATLGSYWFSALFQQRPLPSMSGVVIGDMLQVCGPEDIPHYNHLKYCRSWDLAASVAKGDYTAGILMAKHVKHDRYYILDVKRFRKSPAGTEQEIKETTAGDGAGVRIRMEQEPGASGKSLIAHYKREVIPGYPFKGVPPSGPIEARASPFLAAVEDGQVKMVRAQWNQDFRDECNFFPDGEHDDQISSVSYAYNELEGGKFNLATWGRQGQDKQAAKQVAGVAVRGRDARVATESTGKVITGIAWGRKTPGTDHRRR